MSLAARPNRTSSRWLVTLTLATTLLAAEARAADAPGEPPADAYKMVVDAPSPLKETLMRDVGLARWQAYAAMTEDLLDRLAREAIDETRNAAAAEGWFSAAIDVTIDRRTTPPTVTLTVTPGDPTLITSVNLEVNGTGAGTMHTTTSRVSLSAGPLSVFDLNGSAIIIHANADSYCPHGAEAGCAGGPRQACGVVQLSR